ATYGFDTYGYPTSTATGSVQDYRYVFDATTGNLTSRQNFLRSKSESFTYDNLDRLLTATGPQNLTMTYNANGNINTKSDIGTTAFGYGTSAGPYALTGVTSSTNLIPSTSQTATYTSFEKVSTLTEGVYSAAFIYNSDNQRAKMTVTQSGSTILTRWYVGSSYMKEVVGGVTKEYNYIGGDAYTAPVVAVIQSGSVNYYYLLRDYLGNITHQVNTSNTVVAEYNFDAWGRRRSADDWSYTLDANDLALFADRGFTSHEYLSWFNLYNMNGRLYDPLVARFISPDPYVQAPDMTQSMNRYTYCMNNPLLYVDYNGYTWFSKLGNWVDKNANQIITVAATVVVVAAVTVATAGMGTPLLAAALIGGAGGFTSGAASTWLNGGSFTQGLGAGAINGAIGAVAGIAGGAAAGWASKSIGNFALNSLELSGKSALGGALSGAIGGGVAGGVGGFATGFAMTGNFNKALQMAGQGAIFGGIAGAATGGYRGFKDAKALGNDPWTGKIINERTTIEYPSVGAKGSSVDVKKINDSFLKKNGLDAHEIKYEYLGKGAKVSNFDLYKVPSGQIIILEKGGTGGPIWTDYNIKY
ncbi:MAG: RHS repeat-associated core domain-containing protein, partial [Ignavibacteria bacterium]|nr:RHS repeat-associated core domain-containing protein [Ignavibacteria bacterium]